MGFWDFGNLGLFIFRWTALMKVWRGRFPVQEGWALVRGYRCSKDAGLQSVGKGHSETYGWEWPYEMYGRRQSGKRAKHIRHQREWTLLAGSRITGDSPFVSFFICLMRLPVWGTESLPHNGLFFGFFVICLQMSWFFVILASPKLLAFDNKNKNVFILYCAHLFVTLQY